MVVVVVAAFVGIRLFDELCRKKYKKLTRRRMKRFVRNYDLLLDVFKYYVCSRFKVPRRRLVTTNSSSVTTRYPVLKKAFNRSQVLQQTVHNTSNTSNAHNESV